jgi:hypothetical protein
VDTWGWWIHGDGGYMGMVGWDTYLQEYCGSMFIQEQRIDPFDILHINFTTLHDN